MKIIVDRREYANGEIVDISDSSDEYAGPFPADDNSPGFRGELPY